MTNTTEPTSLIASDLMTEEYSAPLQQALASLMLTIRARQPMEIVRIKHSDYHKDHSSERAAYVALNWNDADGQPRAVVSVDTTGQYWAENPPHASPGINDPYSVFDKVIDAVNYQYDIQTFVDDAGNAILAWHRGSHGNCPTMVLTPDNITYTYYQAPPETAQLLDQTPKCRYGSLRQN